MKLCHQQSLCYLKAKGGWQLFPMTSPPLPSVRCWVPVGRWDLLTCPVIHSHLHQAGIPSMYLGNGDVYPEHSPSEPRAQSRGLSEMQAARQDPAQAVCPALHSFHFKSANCTHFILSLKFRTTTSTEFLHSRRLHSCNSSVF